MITIQQSKTADTRTCDVSKVSKEQLLDAIWEEPELVTPNVIEVAINQIRQKMDKPLNIATIETIRRRGYRFCYPPKVEKEA